MEGFGRPSPHPGRPPVEPLGLPRSRVLVEGAELPCQQEDNLAISRPQGSPGGHQFSFGAGSGWPPGARGLGQLLRQFDVEVHEAHDGCSKGERATPEDV